MPRIDEMPDYRAKMPKSVHDLSHRFGFTCTVAHLLPIFHDFLNAGETVNLGFDYKLRTQPLQSAAMVKLNTHVEYFFVPMQLLYEPFGSMYYGLNDNYSSNFPVNQNSNNVLDSFPVLDFNVVQTQLVGNLTNTVGFENWYNHCYRLMDFLGFNCLDMQLAPGNTNVNPNVFPYQLLAYHCIYQYYYRLDNRERFNQHAFNWDKYYATLTVNPSLVESQTLMQLHYRPKDDDYFTNIKVSPIVDVLNLNIKDNFEVANNWLTRNGIQGNISGSVLTQGRVGSTGSGDLVSPMYDVNPSTNISTNFGFRAVTTGNPNQPIYNGLDINTANIRAMFASEKLWSITGRARKHYDDQTLSHFGFEVPHDVKHEITCFGHDRGQIQIGEVISTADTTNAGLGEIAGKGYGVLESKRHKFTAPCHGVVMAIFSVVPELTYGDTFLKANVMTSRSDLYQPEYDHLGMQPLFAYETNPGDFSTWTNIIGWQYRYEQWKRRYNRVSKAFSSTGSLRSWMLNIRPASSINAPNSNANYLGFLHNPSELNQIMLVNYIPTFTTGQADTAVLDGDPFVVDGYIDCKKVSTMSDYSLPRLDA